MLRGHGFWYNLGGVDQCCSYSPLDNIPESTACAWAWMKQIILMAPKTLR